MNKVLLIVDEYHRFRTTADNHQDMDPEGEALGLAQAIKPLGTHEQRIALLSSDDIEGLRAFQNAGYQTITMNGNRSQDLREFIGHMILQLALQRRFILLRHVEYYYDVSESKNRGKTGLFRKFKTS